MGVTSARQSRASAPGTASSEHRCPPVPRIRAEDGIFRRHLPGKSDKGRTTGARIAKGARGEGFTTLDAQSRGAQGSADGRAPGRGHFAALDEQTVVLPGTAAAALIVPSLATSLTPVLNQRKLLAACVGPAPATRASGSSIRGEHPSRRGNKQLKRALHLAAFASLSRSESRACYDRKLREGKHHVAALVCLARHRIDVLFAMLRDGALYQPATTATG